jgi:hypothetical protein
MTQFRGIDPISDENWLVTAVKRNPEAFLVLAAGCALLLRGRSSLPGSARSSLESGQNRWHEVREGATATARDYASNLRDRVTDTAATFSNKVSQGAGAISDKAADYVSSASGQAGEWGRTISERTTRAGTQARSAVEEGFGRMLREQPFAVAALGVAAGAAVAAFLPSTEIERQALQPISDAAADAAAAAKENVIQAASAAGEQLKEGAERRGLSADGIKDLAREAADTFTDRIAGNRDPASAAAPARGGD